MTRPVILAALLLGVFTSGALAAKVSITGNVSQTFTASDNYFLSHAPSGGTLQSLSALDLVFHAKMPTTSFSLTTDYSYYKYLGSGAADTSLTSGTPASVTFHADHNEKLTKYGFSTSWQRSDIATTQLEQSGFVSAHGTANTYVAEGSIERQLSRADSLAFTAHASNVTFTVPGQTPYVDISGGGTWTHDVSPTTSLTNSVTFDWFSANDLPETRRVFWQIVTGMKSQLSHSLTLTGSIGAILINAYENNAGASTGVSNNNGSFQQQPGAANGMLANAGLTYQLRRDTTLSLTASRAVTPTILGDLQKSSSIGLTMNYDVNHESNVSFSTQFSHLTSSDQSTSDFLTASVGYGYRLTRKLRANLSYTFRHRTDGTSGTATSHTVMGGLSRDITPLP